MAQLQFIATTKASSATDLTLDDIPDEIKTDVEQTYELLKTQQGRVRASFPSAGEAEKYVTLVKAYCDLRPNGAVRFRKSPTRNLPAGTIEFRITDLQTENEVQVQDIRQAVENVKANKR